MMYRALIPGAALLLMAGFIALWLGGWHQTYFALLQFIGAQPLASPFLDTHAVLSAAECYRQGIDVYVQNPCDVLGRPHAYTPLWLSIIPGPVGTRDTIWLGLVLDLAFLVSLGALFRPRSLAEAAIWGLGVFSSTTFFALERANNDVLIFLLALAASLLSVRQGGQLLFSYLLILLAGFLKYYPMVLLVRMGYERWRTLWLPLGVAAIAFIAFGLCYGDLIREALASVPAVGTYFEEGFWARNLPYGIAQALAGPTGTGLGLTLLCLLLVVFGVLTVRSTRLLLSSGLSWTGTELQCLATASLLVPACFFTAQNIAYRGILLLLALPGLLRLREATDDPVLRRWFTRILVAVIFILWSKFFREGMRMLPSEPSWFANALQIAWIIFWFLRELLWWWLVAAFLSLALAYVYGLPLVRDLLVRTRRLSPEPAR